jgi:peroxiredoxin/Flp pilus assembly protein TadD
LKPWAGARRFSTRGGTPVAAFRRLGGKMRGYVVKLGLVAALAVGTALAAEPAGAQEPSEAEQKEYAAARTIEDPTARAAALRKFLTAHPKSQLAPFAHGILVAALAEAKAPSAELVAAGEAALAVAPEGPMMAQLANSLAFELAERGEQLDKALTFAERALAGVPAGERYDDMRAATQDTLGWVHFKRGESDKAIAALSAAASAAPGQQEILWHLGQAYEKAGKTDEAIDAYIRAAAVFLGKDKRADESLRPLYQRKHGSLEGLEERLAAARQKSLQEVAFESRRYERPAPEWELRDLSGKTVKLSDFKGKIVVLDWWGSWCPPCRAELPSFQAMYEKYKDKGVVFLGMNWERPGEPEVRMKKVTEFMTENKYTFPVVIDHDKVAAEAYEVQGFPTVYLIDKTGTIRYRNLGYDVGVEQILEAQLLSLMK